jgi:hypothetical protein
LFCTGSRAPLDWLPRVYFLFDSLTIADECYRTFI